MPGYIQLPTPADQVCTEVESSEVATSIDLNTLVTAALSASSEPAPVGGSYADVIVTLSNSGDDDAYLAVAADLPSGEEEDETAALTNSVIPAATTPEGALSFGPYAYGRLPILRLLPGAVVRVTLHLGRA